MPKLNINAAAATLVGIARNDAKGDALRGHLALDIQPDLAVYLEGSYSKGGATSYVSFPIRDLLRPVHNEDGSVNKKAQGAKGRAVMAHYGFDAERDPLAEQRARTALNKSMGFALVLEHDKLNKLGVFHDAKGKCRVKVTPAGALTGIPLNFVTPVTNPDGTASEWSAKRIEALEADHMAKGGKAFTDKRKAQELAKLVNHRVACTGLVDLTTGVKLPTNTEFLATMTSYAVKVGLLPKKTPRNRNGTASAGTSFADSVAVVHKEMQLFAKGEASEVPSDATMALLGQIADMVTALLAKQAK